MGIDARRNAPQIQAAIKEAEWKLVPKDWKSAKFFGNIVIPLDGPRLPEYKGTPVERTLTHLDKLALPSDYHFVDLGSGLGGPCFAAAAHFDRVTGIENNDALFSETVKIRDRFGISNVVFRKEDFMGIPLTPFNIVFFFKPYCDNFFEEMRVKMLETAPGTYIISRQFKANEIFDPAYFKPNESLAEEDERNYPQFPFYTYVRI
jgi:hypothetical protein